MASLKFPILLLSLTVILSLLSPTSCEAAPTYRTHYCSNSYFYTSNSTYQSNLNIVLSSLSANATRDDGFYNAMAGPDVVKGLFLCRGDINTTVCQECVAAATKDILQRCPLDKVIIIWYDECMLRYSNESDFNIVPAFYFPSPQNIAEPERFNELLVRIMDSLATQAANSQSGKKFATEEKKFTSSKTVYSLVQCTPDQLVAACNICLRSAIAALPMCCFGKQGGRVLLPVCNLRYELYSFYNHTAVSPTLTPIVPGKHKISSLTIVAIVISIAVIFVVLFFICYCFLGRRARKKGNTLLEENGSFKFELGTIEAATDNFSDDNKIGGGGFGSVYKGTLPTGQRIAVKRLSPSSHQGDAEFKNEVELVAKLQHRNIVRLLGFCLEGLEKLLIYEYVLNKSLDYFLFDLEKQGQLDWSRRYNIIVGIAQGILYLHEDSHLKIIHCDLKASNVLLDGNMNPKISDFGLKRIFEVNQTQGYTEHIAGTHGYMAPETVRGKYSVKLDMFSFGVLVIEIVSGRKITEHAENLLSYAWKQWKNKTPLQLLDPAVRHSYSENEVIRCIQIGLLCVEENPANRPTMQNVVVMLYSDRSTLPVPQQPAFSYSFTRPLPQQHSSTHGSESTDQWWSSLAVNEVNSK